MKKRIVATLLCLTMVGTALSACGNAEDDKTQNSKSEEKVSEEKSEEKTESSAVEESGEMPLDYFAGTEITIAVMSSVNDLNSSNYGERPLAKEIEEATGIKINWVPVEQTTAADKTPTLLAGDMPDMLIGLVGKDTIIKDPDLFYDLSEEGLLETYAPDVYEDYMEAGQGIWDVITLVDGSVRALATGFEANMEEEVGNVWFINKTWLDQLGLDMPTTTDELYEVLCAFRDNDLNGNGDTTDEIPLSYAQSHWSAKIGYLAGFFGIAGQGTGFGDLSYMLKDGKIVSTYDTQEFRDYLEYCHKLQSEGLLDVDGFSQSGEQFKNEYYAGLAGIGSAWRLSTYVPADMMENYTELGPIQAYEDVECVLAGTKGKTLAGTGCVISAATENVEACLWVWNYLTGDPVRAYTAFRGHEGVFWELVDGKIKDIPADKVVIPEGYDTNTYVPSHGILNTGTIGFRSSADQERYFYKFLEDRTERLYNVTQVYDYVLDEFPPVYNYDPELKAELDDIQLELGEYVGNFCATAIMEGLDDAKWEEHLDMLEQLKYPEYLDWYQRYCDREL